MVHNIEIDQKPEIVFDYIAQLDKHGEWQAAILESRKESAGATRKGTRNTELRKMPGGPREVTSEIIIYDPPKKIAARSVSESPIQATITITVEPLKGGQAATVSFQDDLVGKGIGKLFVIFARKNNRREIPKDLLRLKKRLEAFKEP